MPGCVVLLYGAKSSLWEKGLGTGNGPRGPRGGHCLAAVQISARPLVRGGEIPTSRVGICPRLPSVRLGCAEEVGPYPSQTGGASYIPPSTGCGEIALYCSR
jgi:hypothetical protein